MLKQAGKSGRMEVVVRENADRAWAILSARETVAAPSREENTIRFEWKGTDADLPLLLKALVDDGVHVQSWKEVETTLEEAFLRLTKGEVA